MTSDTPSSDTTHNTLYLFYLRSPIWHAYDGSDTTLCGRPVARDIEAGDAQFTETHPSPSERTICPVCEEDPSSTHWTENG